jgi:hypothetical protein
VDAFLAAGHERLGVEPLPPAPPEVLLRRVYLDLIGLPPSREELRAFLNDPSDVAYERIVDRLLASPLHGERWARHWMDVWRYSDWYGRRSVPDVTNSYGMIWRWRDWIVRSLNADAGYDRMVADMLAADELRPGDDAAAVATGFVLRNFYRWNYNLWMKDNVEHTAKAFLGLTLNCAHCHDHKYDPITHQDYFAFRAFFEPLEVRHDRVPGEADPGVYPKYDYGKSYGPITSGIARVFDEKLDAQTFLYTRGESRNIVPGRPPVPPGPLAFLSGKTFRVEPINLPPEAYYPGLKSFVRAEEIGKCDRAVKAAREALAASRQRLAAARGALDEAEASWSSARPVPAFSGRDDLPAFAPGLVAPPAQVIEARGGAEAARLAEAADAAALDAAEADLNALRAKIAADDARYRKIGGDPAALAREASHAERFATLARARADAARKQQALDQARRGAKGSAPVVKAESDLAAARKAVEVATREAETVSDRYTPLGPVYPSQSTGRRAALARWITARDNPLTARVAVNHLWRWHFHRPLVASTYDFGRNGKRPTHTELLDWLAVELMEPGQGGGKPWSMKRLHRLIVTSTAYRMASSTAPGEDSHQRAADRENVAYWHFPASRVEAEVVRDGLLACAGVLDPTMGGPDIDHAQGLVSQRRSLYFTHHGESRMPFLELFDAPDACEAYTRTESVVPQQALALTNNELTRRLSRTLAGRLWQGVQTDSEPTRAFIIAAFEQVLCRRPKPRELDLSLGFLADQRKLFTTGDPEARAREDFVHALFNHNDFLTVR